MADKKLVKITGTVVLVKTNVLGFNDFIDSFLDGIQDFVVRGITFQLVKTFTLGKLVVEVIVHDDGAWDAHLVIPLEGQAEAGASRPKKGPSRTPFLQFRRFSHLTLVPVLFNKK